MFISDKNDASAHSPFTSFSITFVAGLPLVPTNHLVVIKCFVKVNLFENLQLIKSFLDPVDIDTLLFTRFA